MPIKTQMRLAQVTGSLPAFKPVAFAQGGLAANPLAAMASQDMDGVLKYFAQAISNIHGDLEYGDGLPGLIQAKNGSNYDLKLHQLDAGQKIHLQSLGPLELDATALTGDFTGAMSLDAALSSNITMGTNVGSKQTLIIAATNADGSNVADIDVDADGEVLIDGAVGLKLGTNADKPVDIDASTLQVDASDDSNITVSGAAKNLVVAVSGGGAQRVDIGSAGTGTNAVDINATAGGVDIDAAGAFDVQAATMSMDATGVANLTVTAAADAADLTISMLNDGTPRNSSIIVDSAGTGADAIKLNASAGGIDVDTTATLAVDANALVMALADSSSIILTSSEAAEDLTIQQVGGNDSGIHILAAGTGADAIKLAAAGGGVDVDGVDIFVTATQTLSAQGGGLSKFGDDTGTIQFGGTGATALDGVTTLDLQASGLVKLDSSGANIQIGGDAANFDILIGQAGNRKVRIGGATAKVGVSGSSEAGLSGSVTFSTDSGRAVDGYGMDPLHGGNMAFAKWTEFAPFRAKPIFTKTTTVIGALNALADSVASSEPTLFEQELTANINAGGDVVLDKVAGDAANFAPSVGDNKAQCFVNGQLMRSSSGGGTNDYLIKAGATNTLIFQFDLKDDDIVQLMDFS